MNRKQTTTDPGDTSQFKIGPDEVKRIVRRFISPGGDDEEIADFMRLLYSLANAKDEHERDSIMVAAEEVATIYSPATGKALRAVISARHRAIAG